MAKTVKLPQLLRENTFAPPEIPKRMMWTQSSLKEFRRCKRKFFWKYIFKIRKRTPDFALSVGSAFHNSLGKWYRGKRSSLPKIAIPFHKALEKELLEQGDMYDQKDYDKASRTVMSFLGMMRAYSELYHDDREKWNIDRKCIEHRVTVDMGDFDLSGMLDLRVKGRFVVEHKTASRITDNYIERVPLDTQVRAYALMAKMCGYPEDTVLYDVVKKCELRRKSGESSREFGDRVTDDYMARPSFYFYREELHIPKQDLAAVEFEIRQTHREFLQVIECAKKSGLSPTDPRAWTPNDATCDDFFRLCEYFWLCRNGFTNADTHHFDQNEVMHIELERLP